jgi:DNA repair protein RecN (Recombination protein N)
VLRELQLRNFAVIDQASLITDSGLNVLTGETGAGKSMILNALGLIRGERASADVIRHGEEEATVEAFFSPLPPELRMKLREAGYEADDELAVKRIVNRSGKNRYYLNGSVSTAGLLAEAGAHLIHIYGQHEQHTLQKAEAHLDLLDAYGGLADETERMAEKYRTLELTWEQLRRAKALLVDRKREDELLRSQAEEIAKAHLKGGEEEDLLARKDLLAHGEKLTQGCREGEEVLYEAEDALVSRLGRYLGRLRELAAIDGSLKEAVDLLDSALAQMEEGTVVLRRYLDRMHFDPNELEKVEDRLAEIHRLKRKYNGSVEDILEMQRKIEQDLGALQRGEEEIPGLEREFEETRRSAWEIAGTLSLKRHHTAKQFKKDIEKEIKALGMPDTIFEVRFLESEQQEDEPPFLVGGQRLTQRGMDQVEFYFSPNPGEPAKPLAKIASGGELSRVMLAIKSSVFTQGDIPTLLFDEVDAGIGGSVAEIVGRKLRQVAERQQVICVTHLPQIAALGSSHYVVRKEVSNARTFVSVRKLNDRERVAELARMLGGIKITEKTRRHAEEMLRRTDG